MADFVVVGRIAHDRSAFTQGLLVDGDHFWESTGLVGSSSLRKLDRASGKVLLRVDIPSPAFAEGLALSGGLLHLLTWRNRVGYVHEPSDLSRIATFELSGEGWGLTTLGNELVLSDGTARLSFLSPADHRVLRSVTVRDKGVPVGLLNELEVVRGEVWANVWRSNRIARIDPATGTLLGWVDLSGLLPPSEREPDTDVLNGIAYDPVQERLYVTGKRWPWIYEIKTPALTGASRRTRGGIDGVKPLKR